MQIPGIKLMTTKNQPEKKLLKKEREQEERLQKDREKILKTKKKTLAILKPGKYLMLNRNHYLKITDSVSVLLIEEEVSVRKDYRIALHENSLLLVGENEIQIQ